MQAGAVGLPEVVPQNLSLDLIVSEKVERLYGIEMCDIKNEFERQTPDHSADSP
jgi:hypothetical protein